MKIQVLSDLHFEFHRDRGRGFVESLSSDDVDVLVLAGDVGGLREIGDALPWFCERFAQVTYVPGNHEYFATPRADLREALRRLESRLDNLHLLDNEVRVIGEQRFVGSTLWFPDSSEARTHRRKMADFDCIPGFDEWIWSEFERNSEFLERELHRGDVLVTHHLPSQRSIAPRYRNAVTNCYFVGDVESLIEERQPALCIHGHTHESLDYAVGESRVVCNPFGYVGHELNGRFKDHLIVEL